MGRRDDRSRSRGDRSRSSGGGDSISAAQVLDRFTDIDDLLRQTNDTLQALAQTQQALAQAIDDGTEFELELPGDTASSEYPFDFSTVVPADTPPADPIEEVFEAPYAGTLTQALIGYPSGTQQAVGVSITDPDGARLIPRGPSGAQYIAFNDENIPFDLNERVEKGEDITIKFANNDPDNDHFINVVLMLREDV